MTSADITGLDTTVKGVNSTNNYIRSVAHIIDGGERRSRRLHPFGMRPRLR